MDIEDGVKNWQRFVRKAGSELSAISQLSDYPLLTDRQTTEQEQKLAGMFRDFHLLESRIAEVKAVLTVNLYVKGERSINDICGRLKISKDTFYSILRDYGVPLRDRRKKRSGPADTKKLERIKSDLAEGKSQKEIANLEGVSQQAISSYIKKHIRG